MSGYKKDAHKGTLFSGGRGLSLAGIKIGGVSKTGDLIKMEGSRLGWVSRALWVAVWCPGVKKPRSSAVETLFFHFLE